MHGKHTNIINKVIHCVSLTNEFACLFVCLCVCLFIYIFSSIQNKKTAKYDTMR